MTAPSQDAARNALMLTELRLPTIGSGLNFNGLKTAV